MSKQKIIMFDPTIYPRKVWVAVGGTEKELNEKFINRDGTELEVEKSNPFGAVTYTLQEKGTDLLGVLVWFPKTSSLTVEYMAHEATHAALYIFGDLGIDSDQNNNEHLAYLIGWIAGCINSMKTNTVKVIDK